jgi:hypothetical protein
MENQMVSGEFNIKGRTTFPSGQIQVHIQINNNGEWRDINGNISWLYLFNSSKYPNGPIQINIKADNGINDTQYANRIFTIHNNVSSTNNPPTVIIENPYNGQVLKKLNLIDGKASDDKSLLYVEIRIDGGPWKKAIGTNSWNFFTNPSNLSKGSHLIEARAFDGELYSSIYSVSINLDSVTPPIDKGKTYLPTPWILCLVLILGIILIVIIYNIYLYNRIKLEKTTMKKMNSMKKNSLQNKRKKNKKPS